MTFPKLPKLSFLLIALGLTSPRAELAAQVPLEPAGARLEARYSARLGALRKEIVAALPRLDEKKKAEYLEAREAELAAKRALETARQRLGEVGTAEALVAHAKGKWIGGADKGIAEAEAKLARAKTAEERQAAEQERVHWQQNRAEGVRALAERQANLEAARTRQPALEREIAEAQRALEAAKARTPAALRALGLERLLGGATLDARLAKFVALAEATPNRLAAFGQRGERERRLVEGLLANEALLVEMAVADGASGGEYGRALEIYDTLLAAHPQARAGHLRRLALAVALEHATPIAQRSAESDTTAPDAVDPLRRYAHFESAFLAGELDPAFPRLSVWDYRMVVNGEEPDEILSWGREMLRNYRPDQITHPDYRWRYVDSVRTDIRYGSQDNQHDEPELQFFQNILKNGGICGRRAFYGRFLLRAFGIPTTARPQTGHAALVHWTPDGWVPCLGAGWGHGWTKTRYGKDLDFLATTQARATGAAFLRVKRAQWIGDVLGETQVFGLESGTPGFWYGVALDTQRALIEAHASGALEAVGQDIAEADESNETIELAEIPRTEADREIRVAEDGVITIPAAATSRPEKSTGKILFLDSVLGGKQLHYSRNGGAQEFEYTLDLPAGGSYLLTARVVTPSWHQQLLLTINGNATPVRIELPFTIGRWERTDPVEVELAAGRNLLRFAHASEGYAKGFSIREFVLTPR